MSNRPDIDEAHRILRADYWQDVRSVAEDLKKRLDDGDFDDRDEFLEAIHEELDGHQRVIYTFQAQQCLLYSDNSGAYIDNYGEDGATQDGDLNWSALAYAAFEADVMEQLNAIGVDVNNPIPETEEEEESDDSDTPHFSC